MCGIFGAIGFPGSPALASQVLKLLRHRGPDDSGAFAFSEGWMAHTRLSIIDLSPLGRQPMSNAQGTAWIAYNGEIYNYRELRRELEGYPFRTQTDTEVILAAYERWGTACLSRLRGMFAFGIWDERKKELFCAVDRFSIKPLYYHSANGRFIFSSEIKPLEACGVPLRPNGRALHAYLSEGMLDHNEETLFEGISQLRPGSFLIAHKGSVRLETYWKPEAAQCGLSGDALEEAIDVKLDEAVRLHLRSDVEVGLSLSSGLDSHVLKQLVLRSGQHAGKVKCFTYSFPGTPYDEWEKIRETRRDPGCEFHSVPLDAEDLWGGLKDLIRIMEGPVGGVNIFGYWRNAKLAADSGIKVLLDGQGADEIFAGYRYYYDLFIRQLWQQGRKTEARAAFDAAVQAHGESGKSFDAWIAQPQPVMMSPDSMALTSNYLTPDFAAQWTSPRPEFPQPFSSVVKNAMARDLMFLKIPKLLRFQDKCAMASSVEVRVPFLDHELVELMLGIADESLLSGGLTKALLRRLSARYGLGERFKQPKLYVSTPQREWIKGPLRQRIEALIQESVLAENGFILKEKLLEQFRAYVSGSDLGSSFFVWKFINCEWWYREFFEATVTADRP